MEKQPPSDQRFRNGNRPAWAMRVRPCLRDPIERSRRGAAASGGDDLEGFRFPRGKRASRRPVSARVGELDLVASGTRWGWEAGPREEATEGRRSGDAMAERIRGGVFGLGGVDFDGLWDHVTGAQLSVMRGRLGLPGRDVRAGGRPCLIAVRWDRWVPVSSACMDLDRGRI